MLALNISTAFRHDLFFYFFSTEPVTSIHLLEEHSLDNTDKTATKIRWVATTRI